VLGTALLYAVAWLLWDFVSLFTGRMRRRITAPEDRGMVSLILLAQRMLKVVIVTAAFLSVLYVAGFNLSAALAGLGIGGIAVALAAQKTIENLFGGIAILTDHAIRVGDLCRVGTTVGTVEDIGLRSTRIRTFDRGLIAVPNGTLSSANIENLSARDKMRIFCKLSLSLGTSARQVEALMSDVGAMLRADSRLEPAGSWIKLANIGPSGIELDVQGYVRTRAYDEFMAARQELLLRLLEILERNECTLAGAAPALQLLPAAQKTPGGEPGAEPR